MLIDCEERESILPRAGLLISRGGVFEGLPGLLETAGDTLYGDAVAERENSVVL